MYQFKKEKKEKLLVGRKINALAPEIGITREYLTYILNGQKSCSKVVAFCITKILDEDAEIQDYFDIVKD